MNKQEAQATIWDATAALELATAMLTNAERANLLERLHLLYHLVGDVWNTQTELCKWRAAIQQLTPGGSEFMSPKSVEEYANRERLHHAETKLKLAWTKKDLEQANRQHRISTKLKN